MPAAAILAVSSPTALVGRKIDASAAASATPTTTTTPAVPATTKPRRRCVVGLTGGLCVRFDVPHLVRMLLGGNSGRLEARKRGSCRSIHRSWPPAIFPLREDVVELRHHAFGEEARVILGQILAHIAKLQEQHQMADIEFGRYFLQLGSNLVRGADNHITTLDNRIHLAR